MIDPGLLPYATAAERRYIEAIEKHGGLRAANRALGLANDAVGQALRRLRARAAAQGYAPGHDMTKTVPDGFTVRGVSTFYNRDGDAVGQWVKSSADDQRRQEAIQEAFAAMAGELPRLDPLEAPAASLSALLNLYTFTDYHLGMKAWRKEGGADWDVKIAEGLITRALEQLVLTAPHAKGCVLNLQGDFLHTDGPSPVTPTSHHVLDADGRFSHIVAAAIRIIRRLIDVCLMRHETVHVVIAEGNHDLASSIWLRQMFTALYEKEPRLTINNSELPYYVFQHGKVMLAFHHGHMKKNHQLPLLFAAQFPKVWGDTDKRYCHTGHRHHVEEREHSGMTVIQHPTLAARDAYAARGGWISERQASAITYHADFGQVARNTVTPEMLAA